MSLLFHSFLDRVAPRIVGSNRKIFGRADAYPFVNMTIGDALIAEDGAMIKISCPATGAPSPKITWLRRGKLLLLICHSKVLFTNLSILAALKSFLVELFLP